MPEKCPITLQTITKISKYSDGFTYSVSFQGKELEFNFCRGCFDKIDFEKYRHIILGLVLNNRFPDKIIHWDSEGKDNSREFNLKHEIESANFPRSPKEKLENLFSELYKLQNTDGQELHVSKLIKEKWAYWFFKNTEELIFYFETLEKQGNIEIMRDPVDEEPWSFHFTFQGITNYINLFEEGFHSNKCFVAMAFQDDTLERRRAIKNALEKTGFIPIIVDEKNISSDKTINDEIISGLRQCKFCIADFSYHKNGVYFESGFALGQGKQVIYTCEEEHFKNAHFDIKPLQHIIYKTTEELEKKLISKIEAWIK
jgi:hypothetical protein